MNTRASKFSGVRAGLSAATRTGSAPVARTARVVVVLLLASALAACGGGAPSREAGGTGSAGAEADSAGVDVDSPTRPWEGLLDLGSSHHWAYVDLERQLAIVPEFLSGEVELADFRWDEGRRLSFVIPAGQTRIQAALDYSDGFYTGNVLVRSGVSGLGGATQNGRLELHPPGWAAEVRAERVADRAGEELVIDGPAGTLAGTLLVPEGVRGSVPVVILVAGSGPTDRDGNSNLIPGGSDNLRQIAEYITRLGYASFRYDKRVVGASTLEEGYDLASMTFDDNVADLDAWRAHLAADPRLSQQVLFGHSEGSTVVLLSAHENPNGVAGVISAGGNGDPIDEQLLEQVARIDAGAAEALARDLERLSRGEELEEDDPIVQSLLHPGVRAYMRSWMAIDPAVLSRELEVPLQILWGEEEERVSRESNQLLADARPDADYRVVSDAGHLFKVVGDDPVAVRRSYEDPNVPLAPEFLEAIEAFLTNLFPARSTR